MASRRWSEQQRDKIIRMTAQGKSRPEIAKALKTSVSSLRRHFNDILNHEGGTNAREFSESERKSAVTMASYGTPNAEIATSLGCSVNCLLKHLGDDIRDAPIKANSKVAKALFKKATKGEDVGAQRYWLNNRSSVWADKVNVNGNLAVNAEVNHTLDLASMVRHLSPVGRDALRVVLAELKQAGQVIDATAVQEIDSGDENDLRIV